ncbi:MAG: hypothetical protein NC048_10055 [Bacteroides sp.]|nr:hypothetical protein [Bacteroides sp.]
MEHRCGECAHITERYNKNHKGEAIMCRCSASKHAHLLCEEACESFKKRVTPLNV